MKKYLVIKIARVPNGKIYVYLMFNNVYINNVFKLQIFGFKFFQICIVKLKQPHKSQPQ